MVDAEKIETHWQEIRIKIVVKWICYISLESLLIEGARTKKVENPSGPLQTDLKMIHLMQWLGVISTLTVFISHSDADKEPFL